MTQEPVGVRITQGPMDWQIIQRRLDNMADISLAGTYAAEAEGEAAVEVRLVCEERNCAPSVALDWHYAESSGQGAWHDRLVNIPAGGPYRIETRLQVNHDAWRLTGDRLHHIGVGDLWVIAGQSNAVGYGHGAVEDPPCSGVHLFRACEEWALADHPLHDPTRSRHPDNRDAGWNDHSPWLAFARLLRERLQIPIGLIPTALGGSALQAWDPGADNPFLFQNMLSFIQAACAMRNHAAFDPDDGGPVFLPSAHGEIGRIAGMVWYQGCSDTDEERARTYAERFLRFVEGVRTRLDAPGLPVVTCQINRVANTASALGWSLVREAQRRIPRMTPFLAVVPTLDLGLSDDIHIDPRSNMVIGQRAGRAALGMVYGHPLLWRAPDVAGAGFEDSDRSRVVLYVENVSGDLWSLSESACSFTVVDDQGEVPVEGVEILRPDRIRIRLQREAGGNPQVHNGAGYNPPVEVLDRENRPLLGFYGIPVE